MRLISHRRSVAGMVAALAVAGTVLAVPATANAVGGDSPVDVAEQYARDAADGKYDPARSAHLQEKAEQEKRDGITDMKVKKNPDGTFVMTPVTRDGKTGMALVGEDGQPVLTGDPTECAVAMFCLSYNSNRQGAIFRQGPGAKPVEIPDYAGYIFYGGAAGTGQGVKNNAASAANFFRNPFSVHFNSNYKGERDVIQTFSGGNLDKTYNNNASGK